MRRTYLAALAALCLLLSACAQAAPDARGSLSLWYAESAPLAGQLPQLADDFNRQRARGQASLQLRGFPDEGSLLDALNTAPPDLLLCSHTLALALFESGALRDARPTLSPAPAYPARLAVRSEAVGSGFYPLGSELTLLYGRADALSGVSDLGTLLDAATAYGARSGLPFFTSDAFAPLLYQLMLSEGVELHALRGLDLQNDRYAAAYNRFAEAAFQGGLAVRDGGAALVRSGVIPCAAVSSASLAGAAEEGYAFLPLPGGGSEEALLAECWGLAVTARADRGLRAAGRFLSWLLEGSRSAELALSAGLAPALPASAQADTALETLLLSLGQNAALHLPDGDSDYMRNRAVFEADFRAALAAFAS